MEGDAARAGQVGRPAGAVDQRLQSDRRLTPSQYRQAFDAQRSLAGRLMVMWLRVATDAEGRVGTVASRRSFPSAVDRNRARRLLREAFRLSRSRLRADVDMVLVARPPLRQAGCGDALEDFRRLCRKAGIWKGE